MTRKHLKNNDFEKLRKLAVKDSGLEEVLDFARSVSESTDKVIEKPPGRIRMPYVNAPTLTERSWNSPSFRGLSHRIGLAAVPRSAQNCRQRRPPSG